MRIRAVIGVVAVIASAAAATVVGCGSDGVDGAAGNNGTNGTNGNEGAPRAAGSTGATGTQGPQGTPGSATDAGIHVPYDPGDDLKLTLDTAAIDATQVATVNFHLTDAKGVPVALPITSDGRIGTLTTLADGGTSFTADQVAISFVMAWLDQSGSTPLYYTPYTLRAVDGGTVDAGTAFKASSDSGGKFATAPAKGEGYYTYTFATKIAVAAGNTGKTHTVGGVATRTIPGVATPYVANAELNFLPSGGAVTVTREVVLRENCNSCHGDLAIHGGRRKDIQLCILCHNPTTTDLPTGNTINLGPMIHRIHYSEKLPSMAERTDAGAPLYPYGIGSDDYSDIAYPQDIGNCKKCHDGAKNAPIWQAPSVQACTSCHDRTYFGASAPVAPASTKWTQHKLGVAIDPNGKNNDGTSVCTNCHNPGGLADPANYHGLKPLVPAVKIYSAKFVAANGGNAALQIEFDLTVTDNTQKPAVTYTNDISKLGGGPNTSLGFYMGGPSTDFGSIGDGGLSDGAASPSYNGTHQVIPSTGTTMTGTTLYAFRSPLGTNTATHGAVTGPNGNNHLVFTTTRADYDTWLTPTGLTGTWEVAAVATAQKPTPDGGVAQQRVYANNDVYWMNAATGTAGTAPPSIVEAARCNTCHEQVPGHGGSRNDPRVCKVCHTPNRAGGTPGNEPNVVGGKGIGPALDTKAFIHGIHLGDERTASAYWIGKDDFTSVKYPDKRNNCEHCHVPGTQGLPLTTPTVLASMNNLVNCDTAGATSCSSTTSTPYYTAPETTVCTACHDSTSTKAHATIMTVNPAAQTLQTPANPTGFAESCDTCHGKGKQYDVIQVHALH